MRNIRTHIFSTPGAINTVGSKLSCALFVPEETLQENNNALNWKFRKRILWEISIRSQMQQISLVEEEILRITKYNLREKLQTQKREHFGKFLLGKENFEEIVRNFNRTRSNFL